MIKRADQIKPGDVMLRNGQPAIVEWIQPGCGEIKIKLHTRSMAGFYSRHAEFLVSDQIEAAIINNRLEYRNT